jgi:hypothetical protein
VSGKSKQIREAKEKFAEIRYKHTTDNINLRANVRDSAERMFEEFQKWTDNHLTYMETQLSKIEPLCAKEEISLIMVEFLWDEVHQAREEFTALGNVDQIEDRCLPFDASLLIHICQKMLPLSRRVNTLVLTLNHLCDRYKADSGEHKSPDDGKGVIPSM